MRTYTYPAVFEPGDEAGIVITFPDVPEAISQGDDEADARFMGSEALGMALLAILGMKRPLPAASKPETGQILLSVDADIAVKLAVLEAFQDAGISQTELAKRLGKDEREIRRILDPDHATKMPALVAALSALGRRLVIGVEAA
jgi:antitoxin HicB